MALIKCPDCDTEVSDLAAACPKCARPIKPPHAGPISVATYPVEDAVQRLRSAVQPRPKSKGRWAGIGPAVLIILGVMVVALMVVTGIETYRPRHSAKNQEKQATSTRRYTPMVQYATAAVNVRQEPTTSAEVVFTLSRGDRVELTRGSAVVKAEGYEWVQLTSSARGSGWAVSDYLANSPPPQPDLLVLEWHWSEDHGYVEAEGQVKNTSDASLENVEAVVQFYTADGSFITSDSALIEYNPLLRGQTSPFKVMARWNPAMKRASLSFKTLFGRTLHAESVE